MDMDNGKRKATDPLVIDLVLENIFRRLSLDDLLECRQVCRQWNKVATPMNALAIQNVQIVFQVEKKKFIASQKLQNPDQDQKKDQQEDERGDSEIEEDDEEDEWTSDSEDSEDEDDKSYDKAFREYTDGDPMYSLLPEYMIYLSTNPSLIFSSFKFSNISLKNALVDDFLFRFGHMIKELKLDLQTQKDTSGLNHDGFELEADDDDLPFEEVLDPNGSSFLDSSTFRRLLKMCPNLQKLQLTEVPQNVICQGFRELGETLATDITCVVVNQSMSLRHPSPSFLRDLFHCCPKLKKAKHSSNYDSSWEDLRFLSSLLRTTVTNTLTHLTLQDVDNLALQMMLNSPLKLKWLKFQNLSFDEHILLNLLQNQSDTLEHFLTWNFKPTFTAPIIFPVMPKLRQLRLPIYSLIPMDQLVTFDPINYKNQFPSLESLIIRGAANNCNIDALFSNQEPHLKVHSLELPKGLGINQMATAGFVFPNVRDAVVSVQSHLSLRQIWTQWPLLESLFLSVNEDGTKEMSPQGEKLGIDVLFTGLSPNQCKKINKLKEGPRLSFKPSVPSIVNLKNLKQLTIHSGNERNVWCGTGPKVTNASIWAFQQILKLEYLMISSHEITEAGILTLCNSIPDLFVNGRWLPHMLEFRKDFSSSFEPHLMAAQDDENYRKN